MAWTARATEGARLIGSTAVRITSEVARAAVASWVKGAIELGQRRSVDLAAGGALYNADDSVPIVGRRFGVAGNTPADRILAGPAALGQVEINDGDFR